MADLNAAFLQKIFHITEREPGPNVKHHSQADDLRARFKVPEWGAFCNTAGYETLHVSSSFCLTVPYFLSSFNFNYL